jgi:hypothetical protein
MAIAFVSDTGYLVCARVQRRISAVAGARHARAVGPASMFCPLPARGYIIALAQY